MESMDGLQPLPQSFLEKDYVLVKKIEDSQSTSVYLCIKSQDICETNLEGSTYANLHKFLRFLRVERGYKGQISLENENFLFYRKWSHASESLQSRLVRIEDSSAQDNEGHWAVWKAAYPSIDFHQLSVYCANKPVKVPHGLIAALYLAISEALSTLYKDWGVAYGDVFSWNIVLRDWKGTGIPQISLVGLGRFDKFSFEDDRSEFIRILLQLVDVCQPCCHRHRGTVGVSKCYDHDPEWSAFWHDLSAWNSTGCNPKPEWEVLKSKHKTTLEKKLKDMSEDEKQSITDILDRCFATRKNNQIAEKEWEDAVEKARKSFGSK